MITVKQSLFKILQPFISKESTPMMINGIYFDSKGIMVATNGHVLAALKLPVEHFSESFIMPASTVKQILSVKYKYDFDVIINTDVNDDNQVSNGTATVREAKFLFSAIDATYPDWSRVIPKNEALEQPAQQSFSTKYLADFQSFGTSIRLFCNKDSMSPAVIRAQNENAELVGVLMPMFGGEAIDAVPEWCSK